MARPDPARPTLLRGALATLAAGALVALFVALGNWQLDKARAKEAAQARLDAASRLPAADLAAAAPDDLPRLHLHRVEAHGRYDAAGQILIDNRVHQGRAGLHVLTPLILADGRTRILVNRGWIAAPPAHAPRIEVPVPDGPVAVAGTAIVPPARLFALAADDAPPGGNAVWQHLDLARYRAALPHPVGPLVIQLAPDAAGAGGLVRDWPRPDARHERHRAYAAQWFGFAAAVCGIWLFFAVRRAAYRYAGRRPAARLHAPGAES